MGKCTIFWLSQPPHGSGSFYNATNISTLGHDTPESREGVFLSFPVSNMCQYIPRLYHLWLAMVEVLAHRGPAEGTSFGKIAFLSDFSDKRVFDLYTTYPSVFFYTNKNLLLSVSTN